MRLKRENGRAIGGFGRQKAHSGSGISRRRFCCFPAPGGSAFGFLFGNVEDAVVFCQLLCIGADDDAVLLLRHRGKIVDVFIHERERVLPAGEGNVDLGKQLRVKERPVERTVGVVDLVVAAERVEAYGAPG